MIALPTEVRINRGTALDAAGRRWFSPERASCLLVSHQRYSTKIEDSACSGSRNRCPTLGSLSLYKNASRTQDNLSLRSAATASAKNALKQIAPTCKRTPFEGAVEGWKELCTPDGVVLRRGGIHLANLRTNSGVRKSYDKSLFPKLKLFVRSVSLRCPPMRRRAHVVERRCVCRGSTGTCANCKRKSIHKTVTAVAAADVRKKFYDRGVAVLGT